jgi:hypothetical protein
MVFTAPNYKRRPAGRKNQGNVLSPSCFRCAVSLVVLTCILTLTYSLFVITSSISHRAEFRSRLPGRSRWDETPSVESLAKSAHPSITPAAPQLLRGTGEPPGRSILGPQALRERRILLSDGMGRWNTGVWPNWGSQDVTLNCKLLHLARLYSSGLCVFLSMHAGAAAGVRVTRTCPLPCSFTHGDAGRETADAIVMELVNHPKFGFGRDVPIPWPDKRPNPRHLLQPAGAPSSGIPESLPLVGLFYFEPTDREN